MYCIVLTTAAIGSMCVNMARGKRVTIMKSSTGNGARRREIACISDFKTLTLANPYVKYVFVLII